MDDYPAEKTIKKRYELLRPVLDERLRRLWVAAEALALGKGGVAALSRTTGLSRSTIRAGIKQLYDNGGYKTCPAIPERVRKPGGGRKSATAKGRGIESDLENLMESSEANDPGPLAWTCKSLRGMAEELCTSGHEVSYRTVGNLLHRLGYNFGHSGDYKKCSLPDRREGFCRIDREAAAFLQRGDPVLCIRFKGPPEASPLVIPVLRVWWQKSGMRLYPHARSILLTSENATASRYWNASLRAFATEAQLEEVTVAHFPPGAWRWQESTRLAICSSTLLEGSEEVARNSAFLDLVLPGGRGAIRSSYS